MTAFLKFTEYLAWILGTVLALPGLMLLIAAVQIDSLLMNRAEAARQRALDAEVE